MALRFISAALIAVLCRSQFVNVRFPVAMLFLRPVAAVLIREPTEVNGLSLAVKPALSAVLRKLLAKSMLLSLILTSRLFFFSCDDVPETNPARSVETRLQSNPNALKRSSVGSASDERID